MSLVIFEDDLKKQKRATAAKLVISDEQPEKYIRPLTHSAA